VAKLFSYLSRPDVQAEWHQRTGYLPITRAAYELTAKSGYYDKNPGTDVALRELLDAKRTPQPFSRGIRLGNHLMIRAVVDEELEQAWAAVKPPKQALDDAVARGNDLLRRFERANK
jgi:sn-glycerol 3-phosphate transport system substrate-binding protein